MSYEVLAISKTAAWGPTEFPFRKESSYLKSHMGLPIARGDRRPRTLGKISMVSLTTYLEGWVGGLEFCALRQNSKRKSYSISF